MSINQGGRPSKDLSGFKELVKELYLEQGKRAEDVQELLASDHNTVVSLRTLRTRISSWGFLKATPVPDTPELRMRISTCFYLLGLEDNEILQVLQDEGSNTLQQPMGLCPLHFPLDII